MMFFSALRTVKNLLKIKYSTIIVFSNIIVLASLHTP